MSPPSSQCPLNRFYDLEKNKVIEIIGRELKGVLPKDSDITKMESKELRSQYCLRVCPYILC
jgi:hypothetical protein